MRLYLATSNPGKVADFGPLAEQLGLEPLPGFASLPSIEETGTTFEANARLKAEHYSRFTENWVLADDSGIEVDALGGAPGVYSAFFAGRHGDDAANNALLLDRLRGVPPEARTARFVCVLAVARSGLTLAIFAGAAEGRVLEEPRGELGFGYDPLFYSVAAQRGFGELSRAEKAVVSHRGAAARLLLQWIRAEHTPEN